ncbi:SusC/RagA family TonB-linked outer membrane protein, partial [Persicitalea sp.]|uniref:SusC/RagA family TonB-linked outer membrane protein n=1 Tax=Persicitalea sp. TaxID=3100273 RepID=UPI0035947F6E
MKKLRLPVKLFVAMVKFSCFHLFVVMLTFGISLAEETNAQELLARPVSVNITNQDMRTALARIEKSADVKFSYDPALLRNSDKVSLNTREEPLAIVLDKILLPMRLTYHVAGKYIILRRQQTQSLLEHRSNLTPLIIPVDISVSGKVIDVKDGSGLPGVNILIKGTSRGTSTDQNGEYSLAVPNESAVLVFSYVGYEPVEKVVGNQKTLNVSLKTDDKLLNEVVVVGYGTQGRGELTVSVAQVKGSEIQNIPKTNLTEALGGRAAGVDVVTGSGAPGAGSTIRIRGANSVNSNANPLIVIDGFPVAASANDLYSGSRMGVSGDRTDILSMINPNDIESIEILKDAGATSIYGARGANGVILITTKTGRTSTSGMNVSINTGVQKLANSWDLMNANQFSNLLFDAYSRGGVNMQNLAFNPGQQLAIPTDYNTNWLDEVLRTGSIQDYNITFNGSSDKTNYSGSVGYLDNQGVIKSNFYKRYSARFNAESAAWRGRVRFGLNTNLSYVDQKSISNNRVYNNAMRMAPNYPVRFPSGQYEGFYLTSDGTVKAFEELWGKNYGVASSGALNTQTPYLDIDVARAPINTARMIANGFLSIEPIKGLVLKSSIGTDLNYTKMKYLIQNVGPFRPTGGSLEHKQSQTYSWLVENTATYTAKFNKHSITALVGQSGQKFYQEGLGIAVEEADPGKILIGNNPFFVDGFSFNNGQQDHLTDSHKFADVSDWTVASYFGRLNYAYEDRYLLTATLRRDGSSKFGKDSKWGNFPGLSAAWNLHNESFFNVPNVNLLKVRGSWGIVGNGNIASYQSQALLRSVPSYLVGVVIAGTATNQVGLVDPALAWESTRQVDIGIDAKVFNRFNITTDMYWKKTYDLLYALSLPYSTGFPSIQTTNLGSLNQVGFEFSISGDLVRGQNAKGFNWFAALNMDHLTGKITQLPPNNLWVGDRIRSYLNQPIGTLYGYQVEGIYNSQSELDDPNNPYKSAQLGDYKYRDLGSTSPTGQFLNTPDNNITAADRTDLGNVNPIISLGFNNTLSYRNFDLTLFFRSSVGNKIYNEARRNLLDTRGSRNTITEALDRWTPT